MPIETTQLSTKATTPQNIPETANKEVSVSVTTDMSTLGFDTTTIIPSISSSNPSSLTSDTFTMTQEISTVDLKTAPTIPPTQPTTTTFATTKTEAPTTKKIDLTTSTIFPSTVNKEILSPRPNPTVQTIQTVTKRGEKTTISPNPIKNSTETLERTDTNGNSLENFKDVSGKKITVNKGSVETIWIGILVGIVLLLLIVAAIYKYIRVSYYSLPARPPLRLGDHEIRYASFHDDFLMSGDN
jgi:hypothetical protein